MALFKNNFRTNKIAILFVLGLMPLSVTFAGKKSDGSGEGKEVVVENDGSQYVLNCSECHGFDGNSQSPLWPNIASLNKNYIIRQLQDFKSGRRVNQDMSDVVKDIPSDQVLSSLAQYFSEQTLINSNDLTDLKQYTKADLALGEEIFTGKRLDYGIPACSACHGNKALGDVAGKYPRLAGQSMAYLVKQMKLFRSKDRSNDKPAQMRNIAGKMDDEDIESIAAYIAYMNIGQ